MWAFVGDSGNMLSFFLGQVAQSIECETTGDGGILVCGRIKPTLKKKVENEGMVLVVTI